MDYIIVGVCVCCFLQEKRRVRKALELKKAAEEKLILEQDKSVLSSVVCLYYTVSGKKN